MEGIRGVLILQITDVPTHLALLSTCEGEDSLAVLVTPASPRQGVADDGAAFEARVEVHCDVLGVVADVDGKAGARGRKTKGSVKRQDTG